MTDEPSPTSDPAAAPPPPSPATGSNWSGGRVVGMVLSSLLGLLGLALLFGGLALVAAHAFARDSDGYYSTGNERLQAGAFAITAEGLDLGAGPADWAPEDLFGTVRVTVESPSDRPAFVGIAPTDDLDRYLARVGHAEVTDFSNGSARYALHPGGAPRTPPGAQDFWVAQSEGAGQQRAYWDVESGVWSVAVMNADGARGISVDADIGVKIGWVLWVGLGLAVLGALLTAAGTILIIRIGRRAQAEGDGAPAP